MDSAGEIRELTDRAFRARNFLEFQNIFLNARSHKKSFQDLSLEIDDSSDERLYKKLKLIEIRTIDEDFLYRTLQDKAKLYFSEPNIAIDAVLEVIIKSEHLEFTKSSLTELLLAKNIRVIEDNQNNIFLPKDMERYLFNLISNFEEIKGIANYIELSGILNVAKNEENAPNAQEIWEPEFELLKDGRGKIKTELMNYEGKEIESIHEAVQKFDKFVLIGAPGAGKSTTLRRLCLENARTYLSNPQNSAIPLFLNLAAWNDDLNIEEFIINKWQFDTNPLEMLASGHIKIYLDGLNEMGNNKFNKLKQIKEWLKGEFKSEINNEKLLKPQKIIFTCREIDYSESYDLGIAIIKAKELSDSQIEKFVEY